MGREREADTDRQWIKTLRRVTFRLLSGEPVFCPENTVRAEGVDVLPLPGHEVLSTRDVDAAREGTSRELCPNTLSVTGESARFHARLQAARLGPVRLHYVGYGARVRVSHEHGNHTYAVHVPMTGAQEFTAGQHRVDSCGERAALLSPGMRLSMDLAAGNRRMLVYVDQTDVESTLSRMLGRPVESPLRFDFGVDLTTPRGRGWLALVDLVRRDLEQPAPLATHPMALGHVRQLLVTGLLLLARHTYSDRLHESTAPTPAPRRVRRAIDFIESRAQESLTVDAIAEAIGVSVRSLQQGFRAHLDTTPLGYLRRVRLARARSDLLAASPHDGSSVTTIALRWGFTHLSRFAQTYQAAYGELPSNTLHR